MVSAAPPKVYKQITRHQARSTRRAGKWTSGTIIRSHLLYELAVVEELELCFHYALISVLALFIAHEVQTSLSQ